MRKAFDQVLLKEMPKLMRGAGFSQQEIMDITGRYYRDGYMPHFRYGDYVLSYLFPVKGVHGVRYRRFVESYETDTLRAKAKAKLPQSFATSRGRKRVNFTEFRFSDVRLDPNSFVQILEHWPVAERMFKKQAITEGEKRAVDIVEKLAKESILGNYAKGRFAQRRGRMGWSKDYERAIKDYFTHVPFSMARRYMRGGLEAEIDKLTSARDKDYARDLYKFWSGGGTKEGKPTMYLRKFIYDYYLMFKPSFMLQNLTQRMTTHLPLAITEAQILRDAGRGTIGGTKASLIGQKLELDIYGRTLARFGSGREMSVESVIKDHPGLSNRESKILLQLFDSGELGALRTKESVGRSFAQVGIGSKGILKYIPSPEAFGIISERSNRLHSALTALKIYEGEGYTHNEMYKKVTDFIRKADFPYSKATRQKIARGFFGSNAFVFKSYLQNYVLGLMPYMYKNSKPAALTASAMFVALAEAMGIPGYNLMRAGVKALMPGNDLDKEKKMADLEDKFDESFAGVFAHGIPAIAGIDGSSWFGFPDLLKLVPVSFSENIKNNLVTRLADKDASVDSREVLTRLAPSYAKHWLRAGQMEKTGSISTDRYGAPTLTPQDINRFPREVKDWAFEQYNKLPTPDDMSDLEKAMYREVGAPVAPGFPLLQQGRPTQESEREGQEGEGFRQSYPGQHVRGERVERRYDHQPPDDEGGELQEGVLEHRPHMAGGRAAGAQGYH
ncbi:MAG: hypothetical protein MZV70_36260 [Desulfobacterales bacterium]|nr:hypothetical protein [Desulfobacterales bacterium]